MNYISNLQSLSVVVTAKTMKSFRDESHNFSVTNQGILEPWNSSKLEGINIESTVVVTVLPSLGVLSWN